VWYGNTKVSNGSTYGKGQTAFHYGWGWEKNEQGEWVKAKALPPSTPPPATAQAQGFNRGTYNGYGTLEARDKHLREVKAFEKNHMKAIRSAMAEDVFNIENPIY